MAGRFPGAPDVDAFWAGLAAGTEFITRSPEEENTGGASAYGVVPDADLFDAGFFGFSLCEALENAGCDPGAYPRRDACTAAAGTPITWRCCGSAGTCSPASRTGRRVFRGLLPDRVAEQVIASVDLVDPGGHLSPVEAFGNRDLQHGPGGGGLRRRQVVLSGRHGLRPVPEGGRGRRTGGGDGRSEGRPRRFPAGRGRRRGIYASSGVTTATALRAACR
ncbi:beta-ketoacyl synthase N-terminal-like domain-containing protein [Streptosporangium sp. H16]|uniref:beta-ketoacyl synthase N-terminal-like domain-containing protein n=1 Tax=Streptosporangium sp. H16 TaxID=3444184 RepID=UPI003F793F7A